MHLWTVRATFFSTYLRHDITIARRLDWAPSHHALARRSRHPLSFVFPRVSKNIKAQKKSNLKNISSEKEISCYKHTASAATSSLIYIGTNKVTHRDNQGRLIVGSAAQQSQYIRSSKGFPFLMPFNWSFQLLLYSQLGLLSFPFPRTGRRSWIPVSSQTYDFPPASLHSMTCFHLVYWILVPSISRLPFSGLSGPIHPWHQTTAIYRSLSSLRALFSNTQDLGFFSTRIWTIEYLEIALALILASEHMAGLASFFYTATHRFSGRTPGWTRRNNSHIPFGNWPIPDLETTLLEP